MVRALGRASAWDSIPSIQPGAEYDFRETAPSNVLGTRLIDEAHIHDVYDVDACFSGWAGNDSAQVEFGSQTLATASNGERESLWVSRLYAIPQ